MRISDWSSDVCSSDLPVSLRDAGAQADFAALDLDAAIVAAYGLILPVPILVAPRHGCLNVHGPILPRWRGDRKSVVEGKSVSVRIDPGCRRSLKKKQHYPITNKANGRVINRYK